MTKHKKENIMVDDTLVNTDSILIEDSMAGSYLDYSMSVILGRAIPDARDGLKPVHRRILYAMNVLGITSRTSFKKSARIIGDVIGKYHPHGECVFPDTRIYLTNGTTPTIKELYDLGIDQEVWVYDEHTRRLKQAIATNFRIGQYTKVTYNVYVNNKFTLNGTGNHPVLIVDKGWVPIDKLLEGDVVISYTNNGKIIPYNGVITKVSKVIHTEEIPMYDFTVPLYENLLICTDDNVLVVIHNSSVYDALVRMAQDFSMSAPLVDGQGNFGSIDGDNAAAMRYTESRLTYIAEEMLHDLPYNAVTFQPNYDDSLTEPDILPARIPNLLLNGSSGIAVGMATNIPPHNLKELIDGCVMLIDNPNVTVDDLCTVIKGPDFPTGGILYGKTDGIKNYLSTGKGKMTLRCKSTIFTDNKGRDSIVVTEIPYQIDKSKLIMNIASLVRDKVIEGISNITDNSDRHGMSINIEVKRGHSSEIVLNNLYKHTSLQTSVNPSMLAIVNKEPKIINVKESLEIFLRHRTTIIIRITIFELEKLRKRLHLVTGLIKAVSSMTKVISIIRNSKTEEIAATKLYELLGLDIPQVTAILDMKLKRLTGLEIDKLKLEFKELSKEVKRLEKILKSGNAISSIIRNQLIDISNKHGIPRRTEIVYALDEVNMEDLIPNDNMVITITHRGYIKRVPNATYSIQNRGGKGKTGLVTYEDDFIQDLYTAKMHDTLLLISNLGTIYWLKVYKVPEGSRIAKGKAIVNMIEIKPGEKITNIIPTKDFNDDKTLVFITKNGLVKTTVLSAYSNIRNNGIKAIKLADGDSIVTVKISNSKHKQVMLVTHNAMSIRSRLTDFRPTGRDTMGVKGINLHKDDYVVGGELIKTGKDEVFIVSDKGIGKKTLAKDFTLQNRSGKGVIAMDISRPRVGNVMSVNITTPDKDIMCLTGEGKMVRIDTSKIKPLGRRTSGVRLVDVKGTELISADICEKEEPMNIV